MPAPTMMNSKAASSTRRSSSSICAFDLLLPRGERHHEDGVARFDAHGRGRHEVLDRPDRFAAHERRPPFQQNGAIRLAGRPRRQEPRGKEVPLARRQQTGAVEHVDVLRDHAAQPDDDVVVDVREGREAANLQAAEILDDATGRRRGPCRLHLDIGEQQRRKVGAGHEGERDDGHDRGGDEGQEQLAIEARPHLAQQRPA